ncbi:MAG TPA: alpha-glucosidase C-terminal domain-containing protein, partial [Desulfobacteria bacterium]|nr:alpha-glucosidase C-terminal domain-containing protein [Desulfobacteria bacterium]
PLVLHTFQTGSSAALTKWAMGLDRISDSATYFNILDSHDGIGVLGAKNILTDEEIEMMALRVVEHGGFISFKDNGDGTASPYELNTTWYSALNREDCDETLDFKIRRFLASRSIALALMGVPGIYLHGLFGSENDADAVLDEGQTRSISRRSFDRDTLYQTLDDPDTATHKIAYGFGDMILKRTREKAFHPNAAQLILSISDAVFALLRTSVDQRERILCITNITSQEQRATVDLSTLELNSKSWLDVLSEQSVAQGNVLALKLSPYEVVWAKSNA